MAGGLSTQDQQALLKAISSPAPNYSGPIGQPSYPSGILSSGAYAPWAGIGDFQPTPMFQMQGPQVSYSNPNTGFGAYMDKLKADEEAAAAAAAINNNNNNAINNNNNGGGSDDSQASVAGGENTGPLADLLNALGVPSYSGVGPGESELSADYADVLGYGGEFAAGGTGAEGLNGAGMGGFGSGWT